MTKSTTRKSAAAATLRRKRWEGVDKKTRSTLMRQAVLARWKRKDNA